MSDHELDFEAQYEGCLCQCSDERLDLEWDEEALAFMAECTCMKRHAVKPTKCTFEVVDD